MEIGSLVKYLFRYVSQGNTSPKESGKENELRNGINDQEKLK